jgi:hypothetical protein
LVGRPAVKKSQVPAEGGGTYTEASAKPVTPPSDSSGVESLVAGTAVAGAAAASGPPSLHWTEEALDAVDKRLLKTIADPMKRSRKFAAVNPEQRRASMKSIADTIFFALKDFFKSEAKKMKKVFSQQSGSDKKAVDRAVDKKYDWKPWQEELPKKLEDAITDGYEKGAEDAAGAMRASAGGNAPWRFSRYAKTYGMNRAAELVGMYVNPDGTIEPAKRTQFRIDESTRQHLKDWLMDELNSGKNWTEVADDLYNASDEIGFTYMKDWRARNIARSESSMSYNRGNIASYRDAGIEKVEVIDGTQDDICRAVNHKVWTLEQAEEMPLGHPNCSRHFLALLD